VPDFLETKRNEITKRLAELKPLVDEYSYLQDAAKALAGIPAANGAAAPTSPPAQARRGPGRPRGAKSSAKRTATAKASRPAKAARKGRVGRPKGSGKRATEALALISEKPGITIPEMASRLGIKPTYFYKMLPTLVEAGSVVKRGRGWHPKATAPAAK
jgi:hypothetical protein